MANASKGSAAGGGRSGGPTGTRALDAALSAPTPFTTRTMSAATRTADRTAARWAPEGGAEGRDRSLGALSFADRLLSRHVGNELVTGQSGLAFHRSEERTRQFASPPPSSWLFPAPWYRDELDWIESARLAAAEHTGPRSAASQAMSVAVRDLPFIAPALAGGRASRGGTPTGAPRTIALVADSPAAARGAAQALRAFTPMTSFAAVQAAEVMAGALSQEPAFETDAGGVSRAPSLPVLELLAPSELAALTGAAPGRAAPAARSERSRPLAQRVAEVRRRAEAPSLPRPVVAPSVAPSSPASVASIAPPTETALPPTAPPPADAAPTAPGRPAPVAQARAVDLLARAAVAERPVIAPASGPRVAMPAGLGGFVAATRVAGALSRPMMRAGAAPIGYAPTQRRTAISPAAASAPAVQATPLRRPLPPTPIYAAGALASIEREQPTSLGHVAWADHWLARFSGASPSSLRALDQATAHGRRDAAAPSAAQPMPAPSPVFVSLPAALEGMAAARAARSIPAASNLADRAPATTSVVAPPAPRPGSSETAAARAPAPPAAQAPAPPAAQAPAPPVGAPRIDDDEAVSDDVFDTLARAAAGMPPRAPSAPAPSATTPPAAAPAATVPGVRYSTGTAADRLLAMPPAAAGPGMRAGLSASPVAAALSAVAGLEVGPSFDVRSMAPAGIAAAYLSGAVLPWAVRGARGQAPRLIGPMAMLDSAFATDADAGAADPAVLRALAARSPSVTFLAGASAPRADLAPHEPAATGSPLAREPLAAGAAATPPMAASAAARLPEATGAAAVAERAAPTVAIAVGVAAGERAGRAGVPWFAAPTSRRELQSSWQPGPGRTAELAEAWSVEQSQQTSDLALDFVTPELVMAAQEYGFGPAEAAQAARIAFGGRARLSAMASAVDYAFVAALAGQPRAAAAAGGGASLQGARAWSSPATPMVAPAAPARAAVDVSGAGAASPASAPAPAPAAPLASAELALAGLGFDGPGDGRSAAVAGARRSPVRGAFLWPQNALSALQVSPGDAETHNPLSLAALDLIAAHVVAEAGAASQDSEAGYAAGQTSAVPADVAAVRSGATPPVPAGYTGPLPESFRAVYLSLSTTDEGRALPPAVRAARALAMATSASSTPGAAPRGDARQRAAAAWSVMPMVLRGGESFAAQPAAGPDQAPAAAEVRRGRAGDSLRSLVAPSAAERRGDAGGGHGAGYPAASPPAARAVPEPAFVETGSSPAREAALDRRAREMAAGARSRGELNDLPDWLETAARKMLDESAGDSEGLTLAEMTLVTSAPVRYIAASERSAAASPSSQQSQPSPAEGKQGDAAGPDVEKLAQDVYAEILRMLEIARERSGEPWQ